MNKSILLLCLSIFSSHALFAQDYERYVKLLDTTITSTHLGFDKRITVTVPFEWQEDLERDFPLIIVFDRQNQRSHNYILNTVDYLTSNEQMPSSIIVSVESDQEHRHLETLHKASSDKGLAAENEAFIFKELIPLAEEKYKASKFRLLVGHSRYGYFTTGLLASRPQDITAVIAISPFFTQENVELCDSILALGSQDLRSAKYYRYGIGNDYPEDHQRMDSTLKQLNDPRFDAKGRHFKEADHNVTPGLTIGTALYEIFEFWSHAQSKYMSDERTALDIRASLSEDIRTHYGSSIAYSLGVLNGKGWAFYNEERYDKAIESWEILMSTYPNFSEGYLYMLEAQLRIKADPAQNILRFKDSLSRSKLYTEEDRLELLQELEDMVK